MKRLSITVRGDLVCAVFTGSQNACTRWLRQLANVQRLHAIRQGKQVAGRHTLVKLGLKITITPVLPESDK